MEFGAREGINSGKNLVGLGLDPKSNPGNPRGSSGLGWLRKGAETWDWEEFGGGKGGLGAIWGWKRGIGSNFGKERGNWEQFLHGKRDENWEWDLREEFLSLKVPSQTLGVPWISVLA